MKDMSNNSKETDPRSVFNRGNYIIILMSCAIIVVGLALMTGDGSTATSFQPDIFSTRRIVVAPICCLVGYLSVIVGILWHR